MVTSLEDEVNLSQLFKAIINIDSLLYLLLFMAAGWRFGLDFVKIVVCMYSFSLLSPPLVGKDEINTVNIYR